MDSHPVPLATRNGSDRATQLRAAPLFVERAAPVNPYKDYAWRYHAAGWKGVLWIPYGAKKPPPPGFTGHTGIWPSGADITDWAENFPRGSVGLRLPRDVLGIDVDGYGQKRGRETLAQLEADLGPLPATWMSTARVDGVSGIRFYRVGQIDPDHQVIDGLSGIEMIHYGHRYAMVHPSPHPTEGEYRWWRAGEPVENQIPVVDELPRLPDAWLRHLTRRQVLHLSAGADHATTVGWLTKLRPGPACGFVQGFIEKARLQLERAGGGSRHDLTCAKTWSLVSAGAEGHRGVDDALSRLRGAFIDAVTDPGRPSVRSLPAAGKEYDDLVFGAVDKILVEAPEPAQGPCVCEPERYYVSLEGAVGDAADPGAVRQDWPFEPSPTPPPVDPYLRVRDGRSLAQLDWPELYKADFTPRWLIPHLFEQGRNYSLYGGPGVGKSLVMFDFAAQLASGRLMIDGRNVDPTAVAYFDRENSPADLANRAKAMEYEPDELENLHYFLYPDIALNVRVGAAEFVRHVVDTGSRLAIIDTLARYIHGAKENDAEWVTDLFNYSVLPLKERGIALVRIDHTGQDESKGARGTSAKKGDVDGAWLVSLDEKNQILDFVREKSRTGNGPDHVQFTRSREPTRHVLRWTSTEPAQEPPPADFEPGSEPWAQVAEDWRPVLQPPPGHAGLVVCQLDAMYGPDEKIHRRRAETELKAIGFNPRRSTTVHEACQWRNARIEAYSSRFEAGTISGTIGEP